MNHFWPVTGGADQEEEESVNCEGEKDGNDGAFRDGNAWGLQLAFRHMERKRKHEGVFCSKIFSICVLYKYMSVLPFPV